MINRLKIITLFLFAAFQIISISGNGQSYYALDFTENKGQWAGNFKFRANAGNGMFYVEQQGFTLLQYNADDYRKIGERTHGHAVSINGKSNQAVESPDHHGIDPSERKDFIVRSHALKVKFIGSLTDAKPIPEKPREGHDNYFIGNDPAKWKSNVRSYGTLTYAGIYPQIDVKYYTDNGTLKYDFYVKPGGDLSKLALKYEGAQKLYVKNNDLVIITSVGEIRELAPYAYQLVNGKKIEVECRFEVTGDQVKFRVKNYDKTALLVIDPTLIFSTFSGSRSGNWGFTATPGDDGSLYAGGIVFNGGGYPTTPGALQTSFQGAGTLGVDIGITRFSPTGNARIFSTYLGGDQDEFPHSLFADPQGNLVILGRTTSSNFPSTATFGSRGATDIIVTKLNAAGTALIGSMVIGGTQDDGANIDASGSPGNSTSLLYNYGDNARSEVILDAANNVYIAASTKSTNFPLQGAFQGTLGGKQDAVVLKINPTISTVLFSSYLGGAEDDAGFVLALNPTTNQVYVAGGTSSANFPGATNAYGGAIDGFISIISNNGGTLVQSRYFGTASLDMIYGIQFDQLGFPYIMGISLGSWTVTANATFRNAGAKQFISKLNPGLGSYVYSTVYGTANAVPNISPVAFLVDRCENVYISGWGGRLNPCVANGAFDPKTAGTAGMPITPDAIKSNTDGRDFYFFVMEKDAASQLYGSFYGQSGGEGDHVDGGTSRFDKRGAIYQAICANCAGNNACPSSPVTTPFPITPGVIGPVNGALGSSNGGECNLAAVKIAFDYQGVIAAAQASINGVINDTSGCVPLAVDFTDTIANAQRYDWDFGDGTQFSSATPNASHTYNGVGAFQVRLIVTDSSKCIPKDTAFLTIISRNDAASLGFSETKLPPCENLSYRFDNLSLAPPGKPFGAGSFVWDFGDNTPRVTTGNGSVNHGFAAPGTYNVKLIMIDTSYCNFPDSIVRTLRVAANVEARFTTPSAGCVPYNATFVNTSQAGQTFIWDFGDGTTFTGATPPTKLYSTEGTFTVTLIATDPNTCNVSDTFVQTITVHPNPLANFSFVPNPGQENTPTIFTNTSTGAVSYLWKFGDGDSSRLVNPVHQFNTTGIFNTCLVAINQFGCADTVCQDISAIVSPLLDVPNAFTPNGDGVNDRVFVRGFGIAKMTFRIYNRQGLLVFQSNDQSIGWDGRFKGTLQPMDAYAFTLEVTFSDGVRATKKGDITLIR